MSTFRLHHSTTSLLQHISPQCTKGKSQQKMAAANGTTPHHTPQPQIPLQPLLPHERNQVVPRALNQVVRDFNKFALAHLKEEDPLPLKPDFLASPRLQACRPLLLGPYRLGLVNPEVLEGLKDFPDLFLVREGRVEMRGWEKDYGERSEEVANALKDMRTDKYRDAFVSLKGWRDECFEVRTSMREPSLLRMERAATCMFGIRQYGVDITGYVRHPQEGLCIWMQKRSVTKQRWPGMWDNMVGGGLSVGFSVLETAHKEASEEASIPSHLLKALTPQGSVSIFYESERGLSPNTEYVFDLELPLDFVPKNQDGEVSEFRLFTAGDAVQLLLSSVFKTTSCPVLLDFLIRHQVITQDSECARGCDLEAVKSLLRIPLPDYYRKLDNKE